METYHAFIDGNLRQIRVPRSEIQNNHWQGYVVGKTPEEAFKNAGAVIRKTII